VCNASTYPRISRDLRNACGQRDDQLFDFLVTSHHKVLIVLKALARLLQSEEVLRFPVTNQGFLHGLRTGMDAMVPQFSQRLRVSFARQDGMDQRRSTMPTLSPG
jgi:hypothetical protein